MSIGPALWQQYVYYAHNTCINAVIEGVPSEDANTQQPYHARSETMK